MIGPGTLLWRLAPGLRPRERSRFAFFAALYALIGVAQTLGLAASEALFLARVGVAWLPHTFVLGSVVTVAGMLMYAAGVGRLRNDFMFVWMLLGASAALIAGFFGARAELAWVPTALLCTHFLLTALFINHFWTFCVDYFDSPTLQRLAPLFTVGLSLGGGIGGGLVIGLNRLLSPESLVIGWAVCLGLAALLLRGVRPSLRRWGPLELEEADESSVQGLRDARRYIQRSRLGQWMLLSTLGLVLASFVSQYLYSEIIIAAYPGAGELAGFLGAYLAITNVIEVIAGLAVLPFLIRRLGVAQANLIHPWLMLGSFAILAFDYRLASGIVARVNRELVYNAIAEPLRHLLYNGLPFRFRGRIRAFLEGIVMYAGMSLAGLLLLAAPAGIDRVYLCFGGLVLAALYVLTNLAVRREYLNGVVMGVREGSLDLSEIGREIGGWEASRLAEIWRSMLARASARPSQSDLDLATVLVDRGLFDPLIESASHADARVRRAAVAALGRAPASIGWPVVERALEDPDPRVRLAAVSAMGDTGTEPALLRARLDDAAPEVRAEAALALGAEGTRVLEEMARSADAPTVSAALRRLPRELIWLPLQRAADPDSAIRAEALDAVSRLVQPVPIDPDLLMADLADREARVRGAALRALATLESDAPLAAALDDTAASVREIAVDALGRRGDRAVDAVLPKLGARALPTVEAALRALGAIGTPRARGVLGRELRDRLREEWRSRLALHVLDAPDADPALRFLSAAYEDLAVRCRRIAFVILKLTEDARVIGSVERALRFAATRTRGDALEVLSNLEDRQAAHLLVLLLEDGAIDEKIPAVLPEVPVPGDRGMVLDSARESGDHWVRRGLQRYEAAVGGTGEREDEMDRLLLLRRVPLFARLTLDQLEAINALMVEAEYLKDEVICKEGDPGDRLFVLAEGEVSVFRRFGTEHQLRLGGQSPVSAFGEIAVLDDSPRSATVVASRDSRLLTLQGQRLKELVLQMPEIAFDFLKVLTARVRSADQRLEDATRR